MNTVHGFPYFPVEFTKEGQVYRPAEVSALLAFLAQQPTTDLLVIAHGWNNDLKEAQELYTLLLANLRQVMTLPSAPNLSARSFAVMGVLWPSKKFAERDLIASGAAAGGSPITSALLREELDRLKGTFDAPDADQKLEQAKALVPELENKESARAEFANLLLALVPEETSPDVTVTAEFKALPTREMVQQLGEPIPLTMLAEFELEPADAAPDEDGGAAGLGQLFAGIKGGALNLLNFTTYYQMKERAGKVGRSGVYQVLRQAKQAVPSLKLHLIGHSFGGRLVTAAANAGAQADFKIDSLTLLQAAFSHHGFSNAYDGARPGFFREVIARKVVTGPILITHSVLDTAVGKMYPLASLVANQVASGWGDEHDKYGGIGRNGAQKTPEASNERLLPVNEAYAFEQGRVHNLNADTVIQNHGDICRTEVASAIVQAIAVT